MSQSNWMASAALAAVGYFAGRASGDKTASTATGGGATMLSRVTVATDAPAAPVLGDYWVKVPGAVSDGDTSYALPYDLVGGSVNKLLSVAGKGLTLLSTAPSSGAYHGSGHAGSAFDAENGVIWVYGDETHGSDFNNAVFSFSIRDGLFRRSYVPDAKSTYSVTPAGLLRAGTTVARPIGSHAFRTLRKLAGSDELEFVYDTQSHAYVDSLFADAGVAVDARRAPFWYYNVRTGAWRHWDSDAITQFVKRVPTGTGVFKVPGDGWYAICAPWVLHLTEDGQGFTATNVANTNVNIQAFDHVCGRVIVSIGGTDGGSVSSQLATFGAVQDLDNPTANRLLRAADFPALAGWSARNLWSVKMDNDRIAFAAQRLIDGVVGVFVYSRSANTVTDTLDRFPASTDLLSYELKAEWVSSLGAAVVFATRQGSPDKIYSWRP